MSEQERKDSLEALRRELESIKDEEHDLDARTTRVSERLGQYMEGSQSDLRDEIVKDILEIENLIKERYPGVAEGIRAAVRIINETI